MAIKDLAANVAISSDSLGALQVKYGLSAALLGNCDAEGTLSYRKIGLRGISSGAALARGSLCSRLALGNAQSSGSSAILAELGIQRSRWMEANECEFIMIEADGSARGAELLKFNSRWQRHVSDNSDIIEWTEGKDITMSNSPTLILNPGAPITDPETSSQLWIDACSYDPAVVWPSSGVKNQSIEAKFSSGLAGFVLTSSVENIVPVSLVYSWGLPNRVYMAQYEGKNRFDIRLADTSNRRGLRLGYAYHLKSDKVETSQSGEWSNGFHFTIPEELAWHLQIDYYIKTSCDFSDPSQERNVAYIQHSVDLITRAWDRNVNGVEHTATSVIGSCRYMDMNKNWMDFAMEQHVEELWKQLDNFIHPEEQWQMYPIHLNNISMKVVKRDSRIEFQLANQYPVLTYVDAFVNRPLALFLDSESPVSITQNSASISL